MPQTVIAVALVALLRKLGCRPRVTGLESKLRLLSPPLNSCILGTGQAVNINGFIPLEVMNEPGEMAQWVRALAAKLDGLSLVSETHVVGEKGPLQTVL